MLCKATVTPDRTISGSYDWLQLGRCATDRQCLLRSPAAVGRISRSISTCGRAFTNVWRISVARAIVGNRETSGSDKCTINRDGRRPMARSIDRCIMRLIVRAIVASYDRSYEHSWHHVIERTTINRGTRRPMVRSIVWCNDRSHDQS